MTSGFAKIGRDAYRTAIEVSGFPMVADEPAARGGRGEGARPYDFILAGLGACTAITLRMYADRKGIPLASLTVHLRLVGSPGTLVIDRRLEMAGPDLQQQQRLAEIAEKTPVTLTLKNGLSIDTRISEPSA